MKKFVVIVALLLIGFIIASVWAQDINVNNMTDKELKEKIDSLVTDEMPLSVKPLIEEAKKRATLAKDTKWMLKLIQQDIQVNQRRNRRTSDPEEELRKTLDGAWTPLRQMINYSLWLQNHEDSACLAAIDSPEELRAIKAVDVVDSVDIPNINLFDYICLSICSELRYSQSIYFKTEEQLSAFLASPEEFASSTVGMPVCVEALRRMTKAALNAHDDYSLFWAQALRVTLKSQSIFADRKSTLEADLLAMKPSDALGKELIKMAQASILLQEISKLPRGNVEEIDAKLDDVLALYRSVVDSKVSKRLSKSCQEEIDGIEKADLRANTSYQVMPGKYLPLRLAYRNVAHVSIRFYRITTDKMKAEDVLTPGNLVYTKELDLPKTKGRIYCSTAYTELEAPTQGRYILAVYVPGRETPISDSQFSCISYKPTFVGDNQNNSVLVSDFWTGKPATDAKVDGKDIKDEDGWAELPSDESNKHYSSFISVERDGESFRWEYNTNRSNNDVDHISNAQLITDRAIYRPGQKIFFKAYFFCRYKDRITPFQSGKTCSVKLLGANRKELAKVELKTDEFGTASGEITVPDDAMKGECSLTCSCKGVKTTNYIDVEDFKRTDNTITFDGFDDVVLPGSQVTVSGKCMSAAGLPVANAQVAYRAGDDVVGETMTDANGAFSFSFKASAEYYAITVNVVDSKGETTQGHTELTVIARGYNISLSQNENQSEVGRGPVLTLTSQNSNDRPYSSRVHLTVTPYEPVTLRPAFSVSQNWFFYYDQDEALDTVVGGQKSVVFGKANFASNEPKLASVPVFEMDYEVCGEKRIDLSSLNLPARRYKIVATAIALDSTELRQQTEFLAVAKSGRMEGLDYLFLMAPNEVGRGKTLTFKVGTGWDDACVTVLVNYRSRIVLRKSLDLSHGVADVSYQVPSDAIDGETVGITIITVRDGQVNKEYCSVRVRKEDKEINLSLSSFRDHSRPGAKEQWTISCTGGDESTIAASMYDSRLDKYTSNDWQVAFSRLSVGNVVNVNHLGPKFANVEDLHNYCNECLCDDVFRNFFHDFEGYAGFRFMLMQPMHCQARYCLAASSVQPNGMDGEIELSEIVRVGDRIDSSSEDMDELDIEDDEDDDFDDDDIDDDDVETEDATAAQSPISLRKDFSETVFFLPDLRPDANGNATFEFTLPDNLTTYNFQALAIDKKMRYAMETQTLTVNKPLNVRLGLPRFATEGDSITIPVDITVADSSITAAEVSLSITDKETGRSLATLPSLTVDFNGSVAGSARWEFVVPEGVDELNIEVRGEAKSAAGLTGDKDGERVSLPVAKRNIEVDESHSFALTDKGAHHVANPFAEGKTKLLSFNYTSNAFIEVLRALPSLDKNWTPCTDTYLGRYESSAIATFLQQKDEVQKAVEYIKKSEGKLSTIDDADNAPWYQMARRLAKHDKDVVRLLSGSYAAKTKRDNLSKLQSIQLSDGSFPWFSGMEGSNWMTVSVASSLCEMMRLGLVDADDMSTVSKILTKARPRIDTILVKDLEWYNENLAEYEKNKKAHGNRPPMLSTSTLEALHARLLMDAHMDGTVRQLIDVLKSRWQYPTMCDRVTATTVLTSAGETITAKKIVNSLEENLVQTADGTAYIPEDGLFHRREQVEAQAMLIFALQRLNPDSENLQRIVNHLVLMKRGEAWPDAQSTSRAVLALLGSSAISAETDVVEVAGQKIECTVESPEFSAALPSDGSVKEATVTKSGKTTSWGSWQRILQTPIDDMKADGTDKLKINRTVEVLRRNADGREEWVVLAADSTSLRIGDKIRVTLKFYNDEALSFVRIRDFRTSAVEPDDMHSGYRGWWFWRWSDADIATPCHYLQITDETNEFFVDYLYEGWHRLSYTATVTHNGDFASGYADAKCMYATEIMAHTEGGRLSVGK